MNADGAMLTASIKSGWPVPYIMSIVRILPEMYWATAPNYWLVGPYLQHSVVSLVGCFLISRACGNGSLSV